MEIYNTEEQQVEAIKRFFHEHGLSIAAGIVIGLGGLYGFRYYQAKQLEAQETQSAAYAALVECLDAVRRAVIKYDETLSLTVIDPARVKKAIGVSGKSGDKTLVRAALSTMEAFTLMTDISLDKLDEHAIDAIAVGLAFRKLHGI